MSSNWSSVIEGKSQCRIGHRTTPVCAEENESVDAKKMTTPQRMAGHQARSQPGIMDCGSTRARSSPSGGAGRGLRHGSEPDNRFSFYDWDPCQSTSQE